MHERRLPLYVGGADHRDLLERMARQLASDTADIKRGMRRTSVEDHRRGTSVNSALHERHAVPGTDIHRDMHCWEMSFNWIPIGYRKGWSFSINVKSSTLRDVLKYKKEKDFRDFM